jgi:hypothetical protein
MMPALVNVLAGGETQDLRLIQMSVFVVLDFLNGGIRRGKTCTADAPNQSVLLAAVPFRINQKSETLLKDELGVGGFRNLPFKFLGHCAHPHGFQQIHSRLVSHEKHLPCGNNPRHG